MVILNAIQSVLTIVIMISIGFILTHKGWFDEKSSKLLAKIVTNVSLPALMLSNLMSSFTKDKLEHAAYGLIIPFASMITCYVIGVMVSKLIRVASGRRGVFRSMFFISNSVFIGLPVNLALFGDKSVPYALLYYIANTTLFWTFGIYGISKDGGTASHKILSMETIKRILTPPLLGFVFAIFLILLGIHLPNFIMDTAKYLGNLTTPLSMIFIGITIYSVNIKDIRLGRDAFALLIGRFIVSPVFIFVFAAFFPVPDLMKKVFVIQAAMPVMTQTAIVSKTYNADDQYVAVMITVSTILSLICIPVYMAILS